MFDPHGYYRIELRGRILMCQLKYGWNLQATKLYIRNMQSIVEKFGGQSWCRIVDMKDFGLSIPEADQALKEFFNWSNENGCLAHLYVIGSSFHKFQVEKIVPIKNRYVFMTFDEALEKAEALLAEN